MPPVQDIAWKLQRRNITRLNEFGRWSRQMSTRHADVTQPAFFSQGFQGISMDGIRFTVKQHNWQAVDLQPLARPGH